MTGCVADPRALGLSNARTTVKPRSRPLSEPNRANGLPPSDDLSAEDRADRDKLVKEHLQTAEDAADRFWRNRAWPNIEEEDTVEDWRQQGRIALTGAVEEFLSWPELDSRRAIGPNWIIVGESRIG